MDIKQDLRRLTKHDFVEILDRGNIAIAAALSLLPKSKKILIPQEGGWLGYKKISLRLGLEYDEVACNDAKIKLDDLEEKLATGKYSAFLYENPGGYFAEEPIQEIYALCRKYGCLVIMDVSGSVGTDLCDGNYADILFGSFGRWKLVEAGEGGFISFKDKALFDQLESSPLQDEEKLKKIEAALDLLSERINFLLEKRKEIINDLQENDIIHPNDVGFIVIVLYHNESEKEKIINYCSLNRLEWTECPRYIRVMKKAISIEVKRLMQ